MLELLMDWKEEGKVSTIIWISNEENYLVDLLLKFSSINHIELSLDIWIEVLGKPNID